MGLRCGIVGLPNVGKSTLFNVLASRNAHAANFPFCTIDPNVGIVQVPDKRLLSLAALVSPKKTTHTYIEFVDIAGLVQGAHQGEGLGNQFLAHIRTVDAIIHVIRCFEDEQVVHIAGQVDPIFDKEVIDHELKMADLAILHKRRGKIEKAARTGNKVLMEELTLLQYYEEQLTQKGHLREVTVQSTGATLVKSWQLITQKPMLYVANIAEQAISAKTNEYVVQLSTVVQKELPSSPLISVCIALEEQIRTLTVAKEEAEFLRASYDLPTSTLETLICTTYQLLQLITYFTVGPEEAKAWTIRRGTKAPQAAGVIHSDFEKKFVKVAVIKLSDYLHYQNETACREAGKLRIEGKHYIVQDGDVLYFRHT